MIAGDLVAPDTYVVSGERLESLVRNHLERATQRADIFAPFITRAALDALAPAVQPGVHVSIVVRWRIADFIAGVADLDLYRACCDRGWRLYAHPRLHLKSIMCDERLLLTGSANVTAHGLGTHAKPNLETLVGELIPPRDYIAFLASIRQQSRVVDDAFVDSLKASIARLRARFFDLNDAIEAEEWELLGASEPCSFLVSQLPMSRNWTLLYDINGLATADEESRACARHDLRTYGVSVRVEETRDEFRERLREAFFRHPFIRALEDFISQPRRFGALKEWVQNKCADVPVPSRRTLTGNVQVLYEWLVELGDGRYKVVRPGHSEVICPAALGAAEQGEAGYGRPARWSPTRRRRRKRKF
jgi:hypothetical protein